ncbi:MAG TPA: Uma2 family endonuclease [Acidimicrobiales bacterium]|nr:Uma2 family endonuclease [Acidimicrobiales bacterium]
MTLTTSGRIGSPFTTRDLEGFPDDGNRYELSYGSLIVTPSPNTRHQALAAAVTAFLHARTPPSQRVLVEAELSVRDDVVKRPDVQVVNKNLVGGQSVVGVPDLVVEVHSPATRALDLTEKRFVYAQAGVPAYWMIDPDASTLTVLELKDGAYMEVAVVSAKDSVDVVIPFTMKIEGRAIFGT